MPDSSLDLLVVAAHPDDAEISVGGILLLAKAAGLSTGVLDLTAGERGTRGSRRERAKEAAAASAILELDFRGNLDLGDARLVDDVASREALASELARLAPTTVIGHVHSGLAHRIPLDRHPDHVAAGDLTRAATFLSGVAKVTGEPAARATRLLSFPSHELAEPDLVVDISSVWERKLEAVRCYVSQLGSRGATDAPDSGTHLPGGSDIVERIERRSRLWGERIGARHAEPLFSARALGLDPESLGAILKHS